MFKFHPVEYKIFNLQKPKAGQYNGLLLRANSAKFKSQIRKINIFFQCVKAGMVLIMRLEKVQAHILKPECRSHIFYLIKTTLQVSAHVHILLHRNSLPSFQYPFSKIGSFLLLMHQTVSMSLDIITIGLHTPMRKNNGKMYVTSKTIWLSVSGSQGSCHVSIDSYIYPVIDVSTFKNSIQAPLTSNIFSHICPLSLWPRWADNEAVTPSLWRVLLESNGAVNCQPITQLFPLCGAGWWVIPVPRPITSGEGVECSPCSRNGCHCPPYFHWFFNASMTPAITRDL